MKTAELRTIPVVELQQKLEDFIEELANLRIQKATHQLSNPNRIGAVKKEIARYKTILREYELGIAKPSTDA